MTKRKSEFDQVSSKNIMKDTRGRVKRRRKNVSQTLAQTLGDWNEYGTGNNTHGTGNTFNTVNATNVHINVSEHEDESVDGDDPNDAEFTPALTQALKRKEKRRERRIRKKEEEKKKRKKKRRDRIEEK